MKTFHVTKENVSRSWHLVDAKNEILGRLASRISKLIIGKGKRTFSYHVDSGDYVVVVNADQVKITGKNKPIQKIDFRHSHYPGGHTMTPYGEFMKKHPERAVYLAVSGMLPKTRLRKNQLGRLRVFKGTTHPHIAQFAPKVAIENESAPAKDN